MIAVPVTVRKMRSIVGVSIALGLLGLRVEAQEHRPAWTVRAGGGLGVGLVSMPGLADYANVVALSPEPVDEFLSVAELFAFAEYRIDEAWSAGVSWGRVSKSIEPAGSSGWMFDASITTPLLFVRRAVDVSGMRLLLTAGAGLAKGELTQRYGPLGSELRFTGSGLGLVAGAAAFAPLDDHLEAGIAADLRWSGVRALTTADGMAPTHRGATADLRWMQLTLQFLIAANL